MYANQKVIEGIVGSQDGIRNVAKQYHCIVSL